MVISTPESQSDAQHSTFDKVLHEPIQHGLKLEQPNVIEDSPPPPLPGAGSQDRNEDCQGCQAGRQEAQELAVAASVILLAAAAALLTMA